MKIIKRYLEHLSRKSESIFPMDSPAKVNKPLTIHESDDEMIHRVMVDFDGTIHKYSKGWFDGTIYDIPTEGAEEFMIELKEHNYEIMIFTTRIETDDEYKKEEQTKNIEEWMNKYNIPFDGITSKKLPAIAYVDDRGINFNGDWDSCLEKIETLKNKRI